MSPKELYDMKLHEVKQVDAVTTTTRVPGGWIYCVFNEEDNGVQSAVFVPYNPEFHPDNPKA